MSKREEAIKLRQQGYTQKQIGEALGISKQYASVLTGRHDGIRCPVISRKCPYVNLRKWMNDNRISRAEFVRRMGLVPQSDNIERFSSLLNGKYQPRKPYIDKMMAVTGMTYEVMFETDA